MILALPIPAEGTTVYEIAPEEQPVYDPETGEQIGTETTYLKIPAIQVLVHKDVYLEGKLRRIVTFHPSVKDKARVENCPEYEAKDWLHFHDKYLGEYRQCRMITSSEVDAEGNAVQECLDDYVKAGKDTTQIKGGYMRGGAYLGMDT